VSAKVTIVGGGPGGLAAAAAAVDAGLQPTLVDEGHALGGQYLREPQTPAARSLEPAPGSARGLLELKRRAIGSPLVEAIAFDAAPDGVRVARDGTVTTMPLPVILAPGATERVVPIPGWTLPGVVTCGAAQALAKTFGVAVGARVVVAGSGPFLLPVACQLISIGACVVAVIEAGRPGLRLAGGLLRDAGRLREGAAYLSRLVGRVPIMTRHVVVEIRGQQSVEEALIAPVDSCGRVRDARHRRLRCDAVCLSDGFLPATELGELAGVSVRWDPQTRTWNLAADRLTGTTDVPGVYAAGAAVEPFGGAQFAAAGGALTAYALAERLGMALPERAQAQRAAAQREARRCLVFASALRGAYVTRPEWYQRTADDTIVCRCEDVRAREIRDAARSGVADVNLVKRWTRAGMGLCQGRTCGATVCELVAQATWRQADEVGRLRARPPLRPLPAATLAATPVRD
jgi:NADPH-dependent 2,4-dienoyl-CoA reductase/sulfur reductase-like enzyme